MKITVWDAELFNSVDENKPCVFNNIQIKIWNEELQLQATVDSIRKIKYRQ